MDTKFDIVFTGQFAPGLDRDDVLPRFAARFSVDSEKAAAMLPATGQTVLKRNADRETAEKYQRVLQEIGVVTELRPRAADSTSSAPMVGTVAVAGGAVETGEQADPEAAAQFNPYARAVPRREPTTEDDDGGEEAAILRQRVFEGAVAVPASRGISWITQGYGNHVQKNLGAWIGAMMLYFLLTIVLSMVPVIGSVALFLVGPVVIAGFMIGAREQEEGEAFTIGHLFSAFDSPGQLMLLAVFYFVAMLVIILVIMSIFGASMFAAVSLDGASAPNLYMLALPLLVALFFMVPVLMAYWFAPALIVLEGLSAFEAMKQSFIGCLKNILPMLVYGLLGLVLALVAAIPLGLGFILLMPVLVASIYVGYKDIFRASETVFTP